VIPGEYIITFADSVSDVSGLAKKIANQHGASPRFTYTSAIKGFAAKLPDQAIEALRHNPQVARIEQDAIARASTDVQSAPVWGLDRIDQRNRPLNATYNYNWTGAGVRVYVIDTGILTTHTQFGGRASNVFDAFGGNGADCNGHGTHVSGTIGGSTYGVAKSSLPRGVRVLDCNGSGSTSGVIAGVDWVRQNFIAPAVANMSLGGGVSTALDSGKQPFKRRCCNRGCRGKQQRQRV